MDRTTCHSIGAALSACVLSGCVSAPQHAGTTPPARTEVGVVVAPRPALMPDQPPAQPEVLVPVAPPVVATPVPAASTTPATTAIPATALPQPLMDTVRFGVDAYQPDARAQAVLRAHAEQLKADPRRRLLLKGHGDAIGSVPYNRALAAKRAEMVAKVLRGYGVADRQLTEIAIGDDSDPDSPDVRRVVLIYR